MKTINIKFVLILLLFGMLISCSDDDKSSTEPGDEIDQALVGTWELTNILAPLATTPAAVGLALTAVFNADGTMELTTTDSDGTVVDPGTWSTSDGKVTITLEGGEPGTSSYSINGNVATLSGFPVDFQGNIVLATLEFTKK
ncbi:MAG: copper resistance protein NlpE [Melioribacteraceae bacterium]|nr:copper resistance protein NlpE [Melioribacteraceae bacterium]